jgi:hypothetical protein
MLLGAFLASSAFLDVFADTQTISNITINPSLDVSRFAPYTIQADVSGTPSSVSLNISGINQDGGAYWDFYADGTPVSSSINIAMSDGDSDGNWISGNVYPDYIYPEIFFATSSVTWNNIPSNMNIRRSSYSLLHFNNSLNMEASASFFIELNVAPSSLVNSADLEVYVVKENKTETFFNSDWRNSADVELVGKIGRSASYHHTHVEGKSSHYLVALQTNEDSTVGSKHLDVSEDFWIILYSNSPNNNRGWNLKYHNTEICDNDGLWYVGSQSGWTTTAQAGCPDAHIHMARRGLPSDGAIANITANYADSGSVIESQSFYFEPLPNLAPNLTNFTSPLPGAVYDGNEIQISWDPATDPNGDSLTYNLYYYQGEVSTTIATAISGASFTWNVAAVPDGLYGLKGEVCDDDATTPLCTTFYLPASFTLERIDDIYSLSNIAISSDNAVSTIAKAGDEITLSFVASGDVSSSLNVYFYSGGNVVNDLITKNSDGNNWSVSYIVAEADTNGAVDYLITASNLDFEYSESATLLIDTMPPGSLVANPVAGNYSQMQSVVLSSSGSSQIRYTEDGSSPSCNVGSLYDNSITVSVPKIIKAVACDEAGNSSSVQSFQYDFVYSFVYSAENGGSLSGSDNQSVGYGSDGSAVSAVPNTGYEFSNWSDGSVSNPRIDLNATANISVSAIFKVLGGATRVSLPPGVGKGELDKTVSMDNSSDIGVVNEKGVNILGYINSEIIFYVAEDLDKKYSFKIKELDLFKNAITLLFSHSVQSLKLAEKESLEVDLDGDAKNDIEVIFSGIYVNRAEITLRKLSYSSNRTNDSKVSESEISKKFIFGKDLKTGIIDNDVRELQEFLNKNGYILATSGPGSPGNETYKFGFLTRTALIRFQKANKIHPSVGYFGPITRGVINSR